MIARSKLMLDSRAPLYMSVIACMQHYTWNFVHVHVCVLQYTCMHMYTRIYVYSCAYSVRFPFQIVTIHPLSHLQHHILYFLSLLSIYAGIHTLIIVCFILYHFDFLHNEHHEILWYVYYVCNITHGIIYVYTCS